MAYWDTEVRREVNNSTVSEINFEVNPEAYD